VGVTYFASVGVDILRATVFFGVSPSALVYPTPTGIPFGIAASAILSAGDYRTGD